MKKRILQFFLVASLVAPLQAAEVRLELSRNETLPSIPVDFTVVVTNHSLAPVELPGCIWLSMESQDGSRAFLKPVEGLGERCQVVPPNQRTVGAGNTEEFLFGTGSVRGPFLQSPRLRERGKYNLRVVFADGEAPPDSFEGLRSKKVALEVRLPAAVDIDAWKWLQSEYEDWTWHVADVGRELIARYPDSSYVPYVVTELIGMPTPEQWSLVESTIERFPDSPRMEHLMLFLAETHELEAKYRRGEARPDEANAHVVLAHKWASRAAAAAITVQGRQRALSILESLPSEDKQ